MQKRHFILLLITLFFFQTLQASGRLPTASPIGVWKTIDDVTGQTKSLVQISSQNGKELSGSVVKLFKHPNKRCVACEGAKHNQPILGMEVMMNLQPSMENKLEWVGGTILDPKNGKTYHCNIRLIDRGHKLIVRGFIGLPLFGRSQTWERVEA